MLVGACLRNLQKALSAHISLPLEVHVGAQFKRHHHKDPEDPNVAHFDVWGLRSMKNERTSKKKRRGDFRIFERRSLLQEECGVAYDAVLWALPVYFFHKYSAHDFFVPRTTHNGSK